MFLRTKQFVFIMTKTQLFRKHISTDMYLFDDMEKYTEVTLFFTPSFK